MKISNTSGNNKQYHIERALYYYFDDITKIQEYTRTSLSQLFSKETMNEIFPSDGELDYTNFVQPVVDRLTNIWQDEPTYIVNESQDFDITENFHELNYYTEIHRLGALTKLLNTICVHIAYRDDGEGEHVQFQTFSYLDYAEGNFDLIFDENGSIDGYWYILNGKKTTWFKDTKIITNEKGKEEEIENPYGILPLVVMQNKKSLYKDISDFWGQPLNQLVNGNNWVNHFINCMNYQAGYSGFDLVLFKGLDSTSDEKRSSATSQTMDIKVNPSTALKTSDPAGDIKTAKLEIYEESFSKLNQNKIALAMQSVGLSPDSYVTDFSAVPQSGISKIIDSAELIEQQEKFQTIFGKYESDLLVTLNTIFEKVNSEIFKFTTIESSKDIEIKYVKPTIYQSNKEKLEETTNKVKNGILSPVEAIMKTEGIEEKEAVEKFNKIVEQKGRLTNAGMIDNVGF